MSIVGIETLSYGVENVIESQRFFEDFGLVLEFASVGQARFRLPEGSSIEIRAHDDPQLPKGEMEGRGVREVIWGVDSKSALEELAATLSPDCSVYREADGTVHFMSGLGLPMGLRLFQKRQIVCAPEPSNAPGHVGRMNHPRRWRQRAYPKGLNHVVFSVPNFESAMEFMRDRLKFRLTDDQVGVGKYLRAAGSNNHHNIALLNASGSFPGMDGKLRFNHANFAVEDLDEIMIGANHLARRGWQAAHWGLGRHRIDSALFYYVPCPAGGEAEYGADGDYVDDSWVPRQWPEPLFALAHWMTELPEFLRTPPKWKLNYMTEDFEVTPAAPGEH